MFILGNVHANAQVGLLRLVRTRTHRPGAAGDGHAGPRGYFAVHVHQHPPAGPP